MQRCSIFNCICKHKHSKTRINILSMSTDSTKLTSIIKYFINIKFPISFACIMKEGNIFLSSVLHYFWFFVYLWKFFYMNKTNTCIFFSMTFKITVIFCTDPFAKLKRCFNKYGTLMLCLLHLVPCRDAKLVISINITRTQCQDWSLQHVHLFQIISNNIANLSIH